MLITPEERRVYLSVSIKYQSSDSKVARASKWRTPAQGKKPPPRHAAGQCTLQRAPAALVPRHLPPSPPLQSFQLLSFQPSLFYINTLTSFPECRDRKVWNELPRAEPLRTLAEPSAHMLAIWQYVLWLNSILAKRGKGLLSLSRLGGVGGKRRKRQHTSKQESSL